MADFYGGDISDTQSIKDAKTKEELAQVLNKHESFLEDILADAKSHLQNFRDKLNLNR